MKLVIIRHGIAEDREEFAQTGEPDDARPLTDAGRKKMKRAARGLRDVIGLDVLATSPLTRALQTAQVISAEYDDLPPHVVDALAPDARFESILEWLGRLDDADTVGVVGHEPHLSSLASWLLTGDGRSIMELKKGAAVLLEFGGELGAGKAQLRWALTPSQLRMIGD
jgi:phosphohistidine phosphatase